jgi:hypothetical protein
MNGYQRKKMSKNVNYKIFDDVEYVLDKDRVERYKYFSKKYIDNNLFKKMLLYRMDKIRNSPEVKLYKSINGIKDNYYDDLYEYFENEL